MPSSMQKRLFFYLLSLIVLIFLSFLFSLADVYGLHLKVMPSASLSEVHLVFDELTQQILLTALFWLAGSVAWAAYITKRVIHPIYSLADTAKRISDGDFGRGFPPSAFETVEIKSLQNSFSTLQKTIAERDKELEAQRGAAIEALKQADRIKSDFLISVGHELKSPLTGIMGAIAILKNAATLDEVREYSKIVENSAERMAATIENILCVSEIKSGDVKVNVHEFNLKELISKLAKDTKQKCQQKGIDFKMKFNVPEALTCYGDDKKIGVVLAHLLQNAVKYTHRGRISLFVGLRRVEGESVLFATVSDTGNGIPRENMGLIFSAFQQVSTGYSRIYEGVGVGLTICKGLLDAMGGEIKMASVTPGDAVYKFDSERSGTIFEITVPVKIEAVETHRQSALQPLPHSRIRKEKIKVLVVEDNVVNQKVLTAILGRLGCEVAVASSGVECIEFVRSAPPDIVFMDCQMPEMDGFQATQILREIYGEEALPIIAVTANALSSDRAKCFHAGMNDFVAKPVNMGHIKDVLFKWTCLSDAGRQQTDKTRRA